MFVFLLFLFWFPVLLSCSGFVSFGCCDSCVCVFFFLLVLGMLVGGGGGSCIASALGVFMHLGLSSCGTLCLWGRLPVLDLLCFVCVVLGMVVSWSGVNFAWLCEFVFYWLWGFCLAWVVVLLPYLCLWLLPVRYLVWLWGFCGFVLLVVVLLLLYLCFWLLAMISQTFGLVGLWV